MALCLPLSHLPSRCSVPKPDLCQLFQGHVAIAAVSVASVLAFLLPLPPVPLVFWHPFFTDMQKL